MIIRSQGGSIYFVKVGEGASEEAAKVGAEVTVQFTNSADEQLSAIDAVIAAGVKGIALTIQDPSIGPAVAAKTAKANIPLVASSDAFMDQNGKPVPVVTIDAKAFGRDVGNEMAAQFAKAGWASATGKKIGIASIEFPAIQSCMDRTNSAWTAFQAKNPSFPAANVFHFDYDGSLNGALTTMSAAVNAHRDITDWLVWSCNDEGVVGALKALENSNISIDHLIGVGLGGELGCDQWNAGKPSAFKSSIAVDPKAAGVIDVDLLYNWVVKGQIPPTETDFPGILVTPTDYQVVKAGYNC